jgi:hypothetical protein
MKNSSFAKDFRESLELLIPYMVVCAVAIAALTSTGSWAYFFDKTFPRWLGLMTMLWLVMGLYFTSLRRRGGQIPAPGAYADDDEVDLSYLDVNPATGMPMMGILDAFGNPSGVDSDDHS